MQEFMSILIFIWIVQLITNEQLIWNDVIETGNAQTCNGRCNQMDRKIDPFISWRYKNTQTKANFPNLDSTFDTKFRLEELQPETTYLVNVVAVFAGGEKLIWCATSASIQFTITRKRYAHKRVGIFQK